MVTLRAGLTPRVQGMARGRANTGVSCVVLPITCRGVLRGMRPSEFATVATVP
jgi:hypothetical protein